MNFFSKLFGFNKEKQNSIPEQVKQKQNLASRPVEQKQIEVKKGKPLFTNAPEHWGCITDDFMDAITNFTKNFDENKSDIVFNKRLFMNNSLKLLGTINENLSIKVGKKITSSYSEGFNDSKEQYATSCAIHKLFDKGIILTNGIVIDNYEKYAIFLFTKPTSISFIDRLKDKFIEDDFKNLIYYCIENPLEIDENDFTELPYISLQKQDFRLKSDQSRENRKYNNYALWWTKNPNLIFKDTLTYELLSKFYNNCYDSTTYILGKLSYAFGLTQDEIRMKLPEYDELIIEGPEDVEIILTISEKTGINFHFPAYLAFEKYRDNFLSNFVELGLGIKTQIIEENFDRDIDLVKPEWLEETKEINNIESISLILSDKMLKYLN